MAPTFVSPAALPTARRARASLCALAPRWTCATGRELTLGSPTGVQIGAWLAEPSAGDPPSSGGGVLLLTDILGHTDAETRAFAVAVAQAGFPVLVPDLFRGDAWDAARPQAEYEAWRAQHDDSRVAGDVRAAAELLRGDLGVERLGMLGFCFGGGRLMDEVALREGGVDPVTAVAFYPTRFRAREAGLRVRCPLMAVFGEKDELIPASVVEELQEGVEANEDIEDCELLVYEGAGHAFAHHPKCAQDEDDCEILKLQTTEWFEKYLAVD